MLEEQERLAEALAQTSFRGREVRAVNVPGGSVGFEVSGAAGELPQAWQEVRELVPVTGRWPLAAGLIGEDVYSRNEYPKEDGGTPEAVLERARATTFDQVMPQRDAVHVDEYVKSDWPRIIGYSLDETRRRVGTAPTTEDVRAAVIDPDVVALERFLFGYEEQRRPTTECEGPEVHDPSYLYEGPYTMAFLPTGEPWEMPAYTSFWTAQVTGHHRLVLALKEWNRRYGAEAIANHGTMIVLRLTRPPQDVQEAWRAAVEHWRMSDPIDISLRELARSMLKNPVWILLGRP